MQRKIFIHSRPEKLIIFWLCYICLAIQVSADPGWGPFSISWKPADRPALDMSFLLDPPAGKYGFVQARDGHFYFQNGVRIRFWGVNLHSNRACFPEHKEAEWIAKRLSQLGCNAVRMHFLDNIEPKGVVAGVYPHTQALSESQLERLDYFFYQLKHKGIYIVWDILGVSARHFKEGDGVSQARLLRFSAAGVSYFDQKIIALEKLYAEQLMNHLNPYTNTRYKDDPALALVELTNENDLFTPDNYLPLPQTYRDELKRLWNQWLLEKYKTHEALKEAWTDELNICGLRQREQLERQNIELNLEPLYHCSKISEHPFRLIEVRQFLYNLQLKYQREMREFLRQIGVRVPIASSNLTLDDAVLSIDSATMDFTDHHTYWDANENVDRIHNRPLIRALPYNPSTLINNIAFAKVKDRPLIVTEWGTLWPNSYRAADMVTTAAYAALQDWDGLFIYAYNGGWDMDWKNLEERLYYETVIFNDPAKMGLFPIASLLFLREDVLAAKDSIIFKRTPREVLIQEEAREKIASEISGLPYRFRIEKHFEFNEDYLRQAPRLIHGLVERLNNFDKAFLRKQDFIESDTGELRWEFKNGLFWIKTNKSEGMCGFLNPGSEYRIKSFSFEGDSDFTCVLLSSLDGLPLSDSKHLILAVVGEAQNTGQRYSKRADKSIVKEEKPKRDVHIISRGSAPILIKQIPFKAKLFRSTNDRAMRVFALNGAGERIEEISVLQSDSFFQFNEEKSAPTIYYEVVISMV